MATTPYCETDFKDEDLGRNRSAALLPPEPRYHGTASVSCPPASQGLPSLTENGCQTPGKNRAIIRHSSETWSRGQGAQSQPTSPCVLALLVSLSKLGSQPAPRHHCTCSPLAGRSSPRAGRGWAQPVHCRREERPWRARCALTEPF